MSLNVLVKRQARIFYGWWVVLAAALICAIGGGIYFYGFTTFFLPISAELGLKRAATSAVFSVSRLEGGLEGPVAGWLIDRFGARRLLMLGIVLLAAGYIAMYWMSSFLMFAVLYAGVISIGYNTGFSHAAFALANKWFIRQRSKASGLVSVAFGLGGAAIVPILGWLIVQYGWRMAAVISAAVLVAIGLPLSLVIRNTPEERGLLPDGGGAKVTQSTESLNEAQEEVSFTVREALKASAFWVLSLAFILRLFVVGGIWVHMVPLLVSKGFDEQSAAKAIGLLLVISLPSRIGFGWLGDIFPKRYLLILCSSIETVALAILLMSQSLWQVYLFVIVFALGYGVGPLNVAIVGEYFGRKNFATIRGMMTLVYSIGIIAGPVYAGYIYDVTQSYQIAFLSFMVGYAIASLTFFFARRPKPPLRATG